jgi:type IV pilus assembly protein PilA
MTPSPSSPSAQPSYAVPIVALIMSIVGVCLFPTLLVGIILGIVALVRISREPQLPGKGMAIAAIVIPFAATPVVVAVIGIYAAIAIPNFVRFQARSKQAECKSNLRAMYTAQKSYFAEKNKYAKTFTELGFTPEKGNRYSYFLSAEEVSPVDTARFPQESAEGHGLELSQQHLTPGVSGERLMMACVGNIDNDSVLDVWTVDENGVVENAVNDVTQ